MNTFLLILLGIFGLFLYHFCYNSLEKEFSWSRTLLLILGICAFSVSVVFTGITIEIRQPRPIHSDVFIVKTEIHQEVVNGTITKSDTVYIFTPKKKK